MLHVIFLECLRNPSRPVQCFISSIVLLQPNQWLSCRDPWQQYLCKFTHDTGDTLTMCRLCSSVVLQVYIYTQHGFEDQFFRVCSRHFYSRHFYSYWLYLANSDVTLLLLPVCRLANRVLLDKEERPC